MNYETIAAYLAGECTVEERQAVENWRHQNIENEQTFQQWQLLWQASEKQHQHFTPDAAKAWQKINPDKQVAFKVIERNPQTKERTLYRTYRKLAAIVLLAMGLGWGLWEWNRVTTGAEISWVEKTSTIHTNQEVKLADGTRVWLNQQSKLRYPEQFISDTREIFLEGEAFFEVQHDPQKPFLIHTQGSVTKVLGTSFHVRSYTQEPSVEVNLVSGKVSFDLNNTTLHKQVTLQPGQKAVLEKATQTITVTNTQDANFLAWKTGKLIFQDTPLGEALPAIEAYYKADFSVADSLLLNCRFTGSFTKATLDEVLQVFAFGSDISYQKKGNSYVLSGKGCK